MDVVVNVPQLKPPKGWRIINLGVDEWPGPLCYLCPYCKTVSTDEEDNFDILGCEGDEQICLTCGKVVIRVYVARVAKEQMEMF